MPAGLKAKGGKAVSAAPDSSMYKCRQTCTRKSDLKVNQAPALLPPGSPFYRSLREMSEYLLTKSIGRKDKLTIVALFYLRLNPSMMSKKLMGRFGWPQASKCRKRPAQPDFSTN